MRSLVRRSLEVGRALKALPWCVLPLCFFSAQVARAETDWVLVLDRSESMTQNDPHNYRFDAQNIMVDLLAQGVDEVHRLTILRFAGTAQVVLDREIIQSDVLEKIHSTISSDPPEGDTDIGAALAMVRKTVKPEGRASDVHVILLSDGVQAGKIANLEPRLEDEKRAFQEMGVAVNTILLNDFSISDEERRAVREKKLYYEDKTLRAGEERLREIARRTGAQAVQVRPGLGIEEILLGLVSPHMSFYREEISGRIRTLPTDRQLFILFNKKTVDTKLRIGTQETELSLTRAQRITGKNAVGDFEVTIRPYSNRSVVMIRPAEDTRWPEWIELLPGPSQNPVEGDVFVISSVRLEMLAGLQGEERGNGQSLKTRVLENEVYPVLFRISLPSGTSPDRIRMIQENLKKCEVSVQVKNAQGKLLDESKLPATDIFAGTGNRLYFVPTSPDRGVTKLKEPISLVVRASLGFVGETGGRPLARAPDRDFVVYPADFEWLARGNFKGEPESSSRPMAGRDLLLDLAQEVRFEVAHLGSEGLGQVEMGADFSKRGDAAARKLALKDVGGVPRTFLTDWIFPPAPGDYTVRVRVKSKVVHEVAYNLRILRDDFRPAGAEYSTTGADSAKVQELGSFVLGETVKVGRSRVINHLSPEVTSKYWEGEASSALRANLLKKDPASGSWVSLRQVSLSKGAPSVVGAEMSVPYQGEIPELSQGDYLVVWPEKRPLKADPSADPRADFFQVLGPPFKVTLIGEEAKPLPIEGEKAISLAGKKILVSIAPSSTFPTAPADLTGTLTWARKDVGGPQVSKASKGQDGSYSLSFPTTDFHTGSARLKIALQWKVQDRDHYVEQFFEISSRPKILGLALEPITENILLGQKSAALRFRVQAIGGQNVQMQRDLMSLWLSQPANVTLGESEQIYRVNLEAEGDALVGSLECPPLPVGSYKLIVSSPVAKLGQDVAASFFNVRPCPVSAKLVSSTTGSDTKVVLEGITTQAKIKGEGVVWAQLEPADGSDKPLKIASAELFVNGKAAGLKWTPEGSGLKSEGLPLEDMEREVTVVAALKDDAERSFEIPLGTLTVEPTPLNFSVRWQVAPPAELLRGHFIKIRGAVNVTGETRKKRQDAAAAVKNSGVPILSVDPPSALKDFQLVAAPAAEGSASPGGSAFGEALVFEGLLKAAVDDPELRDTIAVEVRSGGREPIDARTVRVGSSGTRLVVRRPAVTDPTEALPFFARERLQVAIDDQDKEGSKKYRIQVLAAEGGVLTKDTSAVKPVASASERELVWVVKKEGDYLLEAEALSGEGVGWAGQERLKILPAMKLEWSGNIQGAVRLDSGQRLPLFVAVRGVDGLEWETFQRLFALKPQVLAEGGQELAVDFTPWELQKEVSQGVIAIKAFSAKTLTAAAARVRVSLLEQGQPADSVLDALEVTMVRGGGSLVVVENFEKGPQSYVLRDIVPGFQVPKASRVRFGYRTSSTASEGAPLKDSVTATVVPLDGGPEKVLDIESAAPGLVVFTPYEAGRIGKYKVHLEIKGDQMQLTQEPEFEVTRGTSDWMLVGLAVLAGIVLAAALAFLAFLGFQYARDRSFVMARIRSRMDKALTELDSEPGESLVGSVRLNVAGKTLGPIDLSGSPSHKEVSAWVEQHFSGEKAIFADAAKNEKRRPLIEACLTKARTDLLAAVEKRLPTRGVDVCVRELKDASGGSQFEAQVVRDRVGSEHEGWKTLLTIMLQKDGKLRISTTAGRTVTVGPGEEFAYNGWIGKSGSQIRASVKVPGVADYSTVMVDVR